MAKTKSNSKRKTRSDKFPLTLHPTGQYCKKIKGKLVTGQLWVGVVGGWLGLADTDFCRRIKVFPADRCPW